MATPLTDPIRDPQPGDVLAFLQEDSLWEGRHIWHHLAVVERYPRRVSVLDGNYTKDLGGSEGGSPFIMPLTLWRKQASRGIFLVRSNEGFYGWAAVEASWKKMQGFESL